MLYAIYIPRSIGLCSDGGVQLCSELDFSDLE